MKQYRLSSWVLGAGAAALLSPITTLAQGDAEQIVRDNCLACHTQEKNDAPQWSRISHQRKTPEGWLMTIGRMQVMHGLTISEEDRSTLVKYLSDNQGLAPEETAGFRYAMERRLNTQESFESASFTEMCSRCHSGARVALQRRPASEWEHLVHFHLGQWPTTEYQAMGRDRDWFGIALNTMVPELAQQFPLKTRAWSDWQQADKPELSGSWRFAGNLPGKGELEGQMQITGTDTDGYSVEVSGHYADGSSFKGSGQGIVYTGYEWRASVDIGGVLMRQVLAASEDGRELNGRMFEALHDERGMDIRALKDNGSANQILALQPAHIKAGDRQRIKVIGNNLTGRLALADGLKVEKIHHSGKSLIDVEISASSSLTSGPQRLRVGNGESATVQIYDRIGSLKVVPAFAVARVGDNGGSTPKVRTAFQAEAWAPGIDGKAGTDDDVRIGFMPANWRVEPFDEAAAADRDVEFSGSMNATTGVFTPALAGPNPDRRMSTNNAGNLKVVAELAEAGETLSGDGQLIVTVQRWNNPPLP